MKRYVAGIDGGGTKTAVTVADIHGVVVRTFTSGAINYNGTDEAIIHRHVKDIVNTIASICGDLDRCEHICIGTAGISNPMVRDRLTSLIRTCGYRGGLLLKGDHETALYGAHESEYGIILIAGTGSICLGHNESGQIHRTGGCGHLIDDEGSGYSIGRDLISAVVRSNDGRIPETVITRMVYDQLQLESVQQLIGFVYDKGTQKKDIAALAPILSEACAKGDPAALKIANQSAHALYELAFPVIEALSLQRGDLAIAGSALLNNGYVRTAFIDLLMQNYPDIHCLTPKKDASYGAVLMALKSLG
ncbi:N-acetylglucosamine kinase [Paenibacillus marinisediminis]